MLWIAPTLNFLLGLCLFGIAQVATSQDTESKAGKVVFNLLAVLAMTACGLGTIVALNGGEL